MGGGEGDEDLGDDAAGADSPQPGVTETPTPEDAHPPADPAALDESPAELGSPVADAPRRRRPERWLSCPRWASR